MRLQDSLPDWPVAYQRSWLTNDLAAGAATWAVARSDQPINRCDCRCRPVVCLYSLPLALLGYLLSFTFEPPMQRPLWEIRYLLLYDRNQAQSCLTATTSRSYHVPSLFRTKPPRR